MKGTSKVVILDIWVSVGVLKNTEYNMMIIMKVTFLIHLI